MRVLVFEDEEVLADSIAEWLRREAFAVDVVYDGAAALEPRCSARVPSRCWWSGRPRRLLGG